MSQATMSRAEPMSQVEAQPMPLVRLRSAMPRLRPSERRVADQLLMDPDGAAKLSIGELAQRAQTSATTVVRLYQALGYARLQDLRVDLLRDLAREEAHGQGHGVVRGDIDRHDTLPDVIAKIAKTESLSIDDTAASLDVAVLERAVNAIVSARRIDIFGLGASGLVAADLQQKLSRIGRVALQWLEPHQAWTVAATMAVDCVAIGISYSGQTLDVADYLKIAREAGATTIALTNFSHSTVSDYADLVLTTAGRESSFRSGALGSRIAQLMAVDCLFVGVVQATYDQSAKALGLTEEALWRLAPRLKSSFKHRGDGS